MQLALAIASLCVVGCADDPQADPTIDAGTNPSIDAAGAPLETAHDAGLVAPLDAGRENDAAPPRQDASVAVDAGNATPSDAAVDAARDASLFADAASDASVGELCESPAQTATPMALTLSGNLGTHDPAVLAAEGRYFLFQTGRGIPTKTSTDLTRWAAGASVFASNPSWIAQAVPGATDLWAPDISQFGGKFHLYYSASTFGSNHSCIGHATRESMTSGSFRDEGSVVCSNAAGARDDWNAIDPNVIVDESGTPWLSFGSFWSGIKMVKLTLEGKRADTQLLSIARRTNAGGAIEAPFIVRRCGYYYLFVSFDKCCSGASSTYNVVVGRSRTVTGPYADRAGVALTNNGGTRVVASDTRWKGPGHNAVLLTDKGDYNIYHAYSASDGHSELRISQLAWDAQGWPVSAGP